MSPDWLDFFDDPVLNDKMMSEASPVVKSEHSYSIGKSSAAASSDAAGGLLPVKTEPTHQHITLDEDTGPAINPVSVGLVCVIRLLVCVPRLLNYEPCQCSLCAQTYFSPKSESSNYAYWF
mgnify:FL=1